MSRCFPSNDSMKRILAFCLVVFVTLPRSFSAASAADTDMAPAVAPSTPAAPPAASAQRSAADLEKLAAPIALHPDPLIAIILPASVYPVEVVQAARFVKNTNNIAKLDQQPWDDKVKQVARFPQIIAQMDADLGWTAELGKAFVEQPMDLMNAIQALRAKAQAAGKLKSSPQQVVTTTNAVVERTYENQVVYVTNTVIQVQPASTEVVYVPSYNPSVVYVDDDDDAAAAFISFGVGMAFGAAIWGDCDWHYGGCYWGHYPPPPPHYPPPYHPPPGARPPPPAGRPPGTAPPGNRPPGTQPPGARPPTAATQPAQRWQPDQGRMGNSGGPSAATSEARGWGGASASTQPAQRPAAGSAGARPSQIPSSSAGAARPAQQPTYNWSQKPAAPTTQPARGSGAGQPSATTRPAQSSSFNRPSSQSSSAFSGVSSGGSARSASTRGAASRGGGGGRGGGGRGR